MAVPSLTVAMAVYNNGPFVGEAIDSILAQTFGDFEFLIVNDGSTDESPAVIDARAATDARIRVIHQENRGFIASLNRMLAEARTPWIARMDGDDLSHPERFARELEFLAAHPDHGVVSCNCVTIDESGDRLDRPIIERPLTHEGLVANLENGPLLNHNAVIYSRDLVRQVGGYRATYRHAEDYDLWLRLSQVTRLANLAENLASYRIYAAQVSNRHVVEQTRHAAIAWLAHRERLAGRPDPLADGSVAPTIDMLDPIFGAGSAAYVRRRIVERILYSVEALTGDGWDALLGYVAERGSDQRLWRTALRMLRGGRPVHAGKLARAMLRSAA